jgi:hypothetical protein
MSLQRRLCPERLDLMAGTDPLAVRARADLRRINGIMGARGIFLHAVRDAIPPPRRIAELGAGDGTLMLAAAQKLAPIWPEVEVTLVDRQHAVAPPTLAGFEKIGWKPQVATMDAGNWLAQASHGHYDLLYSNLFIHHFTDQQLTGLMKAIAQRTGAFFACEPRRARLPLIASHSVFLIGASEVTREDAVTSVHAGFIDQELSALWSSANPGWQLREYGAGLFSHCLLALRQPG